MARLFYSLVLVLVATTLSAQSSYTEVRNVKDFEKVSFSVAGDVIITPGNVFKVSLEGDKSYIDDIETEVVNGTLRIKTEEPFFNIFDDEKVTVRITMPKVVGISVSGSGKVYMNEPLVAETFDSSISGSGKIFLQKVEIAQGSCSVSGSGSLLIQGSGNISEFEMRISGSGDIVAPEAKIGVLTAQISGSGSCDCFVAEELNASISGSGDVYYGGNPKVDVRISGSGKVRAK